MNSLPPSYLSPSMWYSLNLKGFSSGTWKILAMASEVAPMNCNKILWFNNYKHLVVASELEMMTWRASS